MDFHKLGFTILQGYGLTETSGAATATYEDDNRVGSVGKPMKGAEIKIIEGLKAYDALQRIRAAADPDKVPLHVKATFELYGQEMGYALLLQRYVDDPRQATEEQIKKAAWDTVPQVAPLYWSFRVMVGLGMFFVLLLISFFVLSAQRKLDKYHWLLRVATFAVPLPWIAAECGWVVAELGRQPWVIEGVLPTAVAVSNLSASTVLATICGFALLYTVLFVIEMKLMFKAIKKGPEAYCTPPSATLRRGPSTLAAAE